MVRLATTWNCRRRGGRGNSSGRDSAALAPCQVTQLDDHGAVASEAGSLVSPCRIRATSSSWRAVSTPLPVASLVRRCRPGRGAQQPGQPRTEEPEVAGDGLQEVELGVAERALHFPADHPTGATGCMCTAALGGWVVLPPSIAAALSPLSVDLERRVLNRYARRELPVTLQSRAYTWSQVRGFRRLYARTRQERPRGLLEN